MVVLAPGAGGGLADLLDGGEQQGDQDANNGNHHEQLNKGKSSSSMPHGTDLLKRMEG
jgi:hypothetical protein